MLIVTGMLCVPPADLPRFVAEIGRLSTVTRQRDGNLSYDTAVLDAASDGVRRQLAGPDIGRHPQV